jgi:hypothetical protein
MDMNSPAVSRFAPSTQPALELIALAQLSPEQARHRLRALLLANPNHFGKVPAASFVSVLKIQEDTTYECISCIGYDPQCEQLCATIDIKQAFGYSGDAFTNGSEEFVRFYLSYDGGAKWLDQGMRSVSVFDAHLPRSLEHKVTLEVIPEKELSSERFPLKVRAILSWISPPPAGAPNWTPVWGNVVESNIWREDSQVDIPGATLPAIMPESPETAAYVMERKLEVSGGSLISQGHLQSHARHSTGTDPQHRFLAFVLARVAAFDFTASVASRSNGTVLIDHAETANEFLFVGAAETTVPAAL